MIRSHARAVAASWMNWPTNTHYIYRPSLHFIAPVSITASNSIYYSSNENVICLHMQCGS